MASSSDALEMGSEHERPFRLKPMGSSHIDDYPRAQEDPSTAPLLEQDGVVDTLEWEKGNSRRPQRNDVEMKNEIQMGSFSTPTAKDQHHFVPALEGLRGVAVCMTMACHIIGWPHPEGEAIGSMGVTIFFCLSGYLITGVLLRLQSKDGLSFRHLLRFYSDRFIRLGPALLLMVVITYYYCKRIDKEVDTLNKFATLTLLYMSNFRFLWPNNDPGVWGHTWSLACEEQYYIIWSLALPLLVKMRQEKRRNRILIGVTLGFALLRIGLAIFPSYLLGIDYYFSLWGNIWKMLLGSTLQIVGLPQCFQRHSMAYVALLGYGFIIAGCYLPQPNYGAISEMFGKGAIGMQTWADLCTALFTTLFITAVDHPGSDSDKGVVLIEGRMMRFVGKISYALYLWQTVLIHIRRKDVYGDSAIAVIAAMMSTYCVEMPISRLSKQIKERYRR